MKDERNENVGDMKFEKEKYHIMHEKPRVRPIEENQIKGRIYISYSLRLIMSITIFAFSFIVFLFLVNKSFEYRNSKYIKYSEDQSIDYRVYLKENDFYENEYLEKNMLYVASLIDKINIDFNYNFKIEENTSVNFDYKIIGNLVIGNSKSSTTNYFEKEYILLDPVHFTLDEDNKYSILENIEIDYNYYNQLANNFKTAYGVDTNSYLVVKLQVDKESNESNVYMSDSVESAITIPLSQRSVEIQFNSEDRSSEKNALVESGIVFNKKTLAMEIVLLVIVLISFIIMIRLLALLRRKKSAYDTFIDRILKEYDRLIVETTTGIDFEVEHIINIHKFEELLDVRDNLKRPIMYYSIVKHQKCYFYIKDGNDVYLMKIKAIDMV